MDCFVTNSDLRHFIIRLDKGEDVLESITQIIDKHKIKNAIVVSGIGTLSDARIHMVTTTTYPAIETFPEWKNVPMELCSVSGIIADGEPHLHIVFSDLKNTYSGHMELGCKTLYLCELVLEEIPISLVRKKDKNGTNILQMKGEN